MEPPGSNSTATLAARVQGVSYLIRQRTLLLSGGASLSFPRPGPPGYRPHLAVIAHGTGVVGDECVAAQIPYHAFPRGGDGPNHSVVISVKGFDDRVD